MRYLYYFGYESDKDKFNDEYKNRFDHVASVRLPLTIKPINQSQSFQLYYIPTNEMIKLCCAIYSNNAKLATIIDQLPGIAKDQFIRESIIAEMLNTNEIEGVSSTREEIIDSVRSLQESSRKSKRFDGMVKSYFKLVYSDSIEISVPKDVRKIYDELVFDEIKTNERPDGVIFRKDLTLVTKKSGSGKVIHQGVHPEGAIISHLENLFNLMKDDSLPNLIKIAIQHYYFGYIHPFYDGNGRVSRFISNLMLKNELNTYTAISLSRACNAYRKHYMDIFEKANSIQNRGELNVFIEGFFELIKNGQRDVLHDLLEKRMKLEEAVNKIGQNRLLKDRHIKEKEVLSALVQHDLFSDDAGITIRDLHKIMHGHSIGSEQSIRLALKYLEQNMFVISTGKKPIVYRVSPGFFHESPEESLFRE